MKPSLPTGRVFVILLLFAAVVSSLRGQSGSPVRLELGLRGPGIVLTVLRTGDDYVLVEGSTNLIAWTAVRTNRLRSTPLQLTLNNALLSPHRFYRVRLFAPPPPCGSGACEPGQTEDTSNAICSPAGLPDDPNVRNAFIPTPATPFKTIRLMFHIIAEDDGSNRATSEAALEQEMRAVNDHFRPWRIQFSHQSRVTKASRFRRIADSTNELAMKRAVASEPFRQLNVFVTESTNGSHSTLPWRPQALAAEGGTLLHSNAFGRSVLTHELGHALGLWHVFHGTAPDERVNPCTACWERADRANADTTGDRCSDTPPVPNVSDLTGPLGKDPCSGHSWLADSLNNFMSLYWARDRFTRQQAGRMHAWIDYRLSGSNQMSGWLNTNTPAAPSDFRVEANDFGEVELNWTDNSWNETGFRIERFLHGTNFIVLTNLPANSTSFFDDTSVPGVTNHYRVVAINTNAPGVEAVSYAAHPVRSAVPASIAPIVYLDAAFPANSSPTGSITHPFPTFAQALTYTPEGSRHIFRVTRGDYREPILISNKAVRVESRGGPVVIGQPGGDPP